MRAAIFTGVLIIICLFACKKSVDIEQPFVVKLNQCNQVTVNNQSIRICYDSLIEDSRCPKNAVCVWQGVARVKLSATISGEQHSFHLSTVNMQPDYRTDTVLSGYKFQLINVHPYPGDGQLTKKVELNISQ